MSFRTPSKAARLENAPILFRPATEPESPIAKSPTTEVIEFKEAEKVHSEPPTQSARISPEEQAQSEADSDDPEPPLAANMDGTRFSQAEEPSEVEPQLKRQRVDDSDNLLTPGPSTLVKQESNPPSQKPATEQEVGPPALKGNTQSSQTPGRANVNAQKNVADKNLGSAHGIPDSPAPSATFQDESEAQEEDEKPTNQQTPEKPQKKETAPAADVGARPKPSPGSSETADAYESEEEKPLDLAAMTIQEYEKVAQCEPAVLRRYEQYRRSDLKNMKVKRMLQAYNPALGKVSEQYIIAVKGLAKLFVGDVVETALQVKKNMGHKGPLQPMHLREAYRLLRKSGAFPSSKELSLSFS